MSDRFIVRPTFIDGLNVVERRRIGDSRGYFERLHCMHDLRELMAGAAIEQINHSYTAKRGAVRGMHFQHPPHAEKKFVTCLRGAAFDVAIDLRRGSPTFLQWHGVLLTSENCLTLLIPEGFAHGFQSQSENCELLYLHSASFHPQSEGGVNPCDMRIGIRWPMPISELSARDAGHPMLSSAFDGVLP